LQASAGAWGAAADALVCQRICSVSRCSQVQGGVQTVDLAALSYHHCHPAMSWTTMMMTSKQQHHQMFTSLPLTVLRAFAKCFFGSVI
jgi:hypothetical protein